MKYKYELSYQQKWMPYLQAIMVLRQEKNHQRSIIARWILVAAIISIFVWVFTEVGIALVSFIGLMFLIVMNSKRLGIPQKSHFKMSEFGVHNILLKKIATEVSSWIKFSSKSPDMSKILSDLDIIPGKKEFFTYSQCLTGCYQKKIPFYMTYVEVGYFDKFVDRKKNQTREIPQTSFKGLFFAIDFPKDFSGWITIKPDRLDKLGWFADQLRNHSDTNFIRLPHQEFESHFKVYSNLEAEARNILSLELMDRLTLFIKKHPDFPISLMLKDQTLLLISPQKENPFTLSSNQDHWKQNITDYINCVEVVTDLLETLQLDRYPNAGRSL